MKKRCSGIEPEESKEIQRFLHMIKDSPYDFSPIHYIDIAQFLVELYLKVINVSIKTGDILIEIVIADK